MEATKKKRISYLDYAKSIAIFFVLLNHRQLLVINSLISIIIPIFMISSGYTRNVEKYNFKDYFISNLKKFLVPFWIAKMVSFLMEIIRAPLFGYGEPNVAFVGLVTAIYGSTQLPIVGKLGQFLLEKIPVNDPADNALIDAMLPTDCQLWTLPALFSASIFYYIIMKFHKKTNLYIDMIIVFVLSLLGSIETIPGVCQFPYQMGVGFVGAAYMLIGRRFKEYGIIEDKNIKRVTLCVLILMIVVFVLTKLDISCAIMNISYYGPCGILSVFLSILLGTSLTYIVCNLCRLIDLLPFERIKNILLIVGRNTLHIYLWHFVVFFICDLIYIKIANPTINFDIYYMELFNEEYYLYRFVIIVFTIFILSFIGEMKNRKKFKILN